MDEKDLKIGEIYRITHKRHVFDRVVRLNSFEKTEIIGSKQYKLYITTLMSDKNQELTIGKDSIIYKNFPDEGSSYIMTKL